MCPKYCNVYRYDFKNGILIKKKYEYEKKVIDEDRIHNGIGRQRA